MSADLTCPECEGTGRRPYYGPGDHTVKTVKCRCAAGRRCPELDEWDALVAERDRLREEVADLKAGLEAETEVWAGRCQRYRKALESIRVRCLEGDKRTDWLPVIDSIARAALDGDS